MSSRDSSAQNLNGRPRGSAPSAPWRSDTQWLPAGKQLAPKRANGSPDPSLL